MSNFDKRLAQGQVGEGELARRLRKAGWIVQPVYEKVLDTGRGPQLFSTDKSLVAPDILGFKGDRVEFFESKRKDHFTWHWVEGHWDTGIDLPHYKDYLEIRRLVARPLWLLFLHVSKVPSKKDREHGSPETCPTGLFGGEILQLSKRECHRDDRWAKGMVYWEERKLTKYLDVDEIELKAPKRDAIYRCYHCSNSYPSYLPECPKCGLAPEIERTSDAELEKLHNDRVEAQAACSHPAVTPSIVGGGTCDLCGVYLFHLPATRAS